MQIPTLTEFLAGKYDERHYPPRNTTKTAGKTLPKRKAESAMPRAKVRVSKAALESCNERKLSYRQAGEELGISETHVQRELKRHGIHWHSSRGRYQERPEARPRDVHQFRSETARHWLSRFWTQEGMA